MKTGAVDFLTKPVERETLFDALRRALELDAERKRAGHEEAVQLRSRFATLTPREREVFELVVAGRLNKQIAGLLGIAERTVKADRAQVLHKLGVGSAAELGALAERLRRLAVAVRVPSGARSPRTPPFRVAHRSLGILTCPLVQRLRTKCHFCGARIRLTLLATKPGSSVSQSAGGYGYAEIRNGDGRDEEGHRGRRRRRQREAIDSLLNAAGFETSTNGSAEALLSAAVLDGATCVVSDLKLPAMSGLDLIAELHARDVRTPFILITAHDTPVRGRKRGGTASAYLAKPFAGSALLAAIEGVAERRDRRGVLIRSGT